MQKIIIAICLLLITVSSINRPTYVELNQWRYYKIINLLIDRPTNQCVIVVYENHYLVRQKGPIKKIKKIESVVKEYQRRRNDSPVPTVLIASGDHVKIQRILQIMKIMQAAGAKGLSYVHTTVSK